MQFLNSNTFSKNKKIILAFIASSLLLLSGLAWAFSSMPQQPSDESFKIDFEPITFNQDYANVISLAAGDDLPLRLKNVLLSIQPGTIIELPEGTYNFSEQVIIDASHVTLRGKGMDKTVLNFKDAQSGEGVLAIGDAFVIEDLAVEDTIGDAIRIEGVDGAIMRRTRVEWTRGPDSRNGSYGFYPVLSDNVLIEDSVSIGASDAGVYVGQSRNAIVRNNFITKNVAGLEIENTIGADVYNNTMVNNTAGLLIFDLPNLSQAGGNIRAYNNLSYDNNLDNFAPGGFFVDFVPEGSGMILLATDDVEVFDNIIIRNSMAGFLLLSHVSIGALEGGTTPEGFDPTSERIHLHDNEIERQPGFRTGKADIAVALNALYFINGFKTPTDIMFDGVHQRSPEQSEHCLNDNNKRSNGDDLTFSNVHLEAIPFSLFNFFKDGFGWKDEHSCSLPALDPIELDLSIFDNVPVPSEQYTQAQIQALCAGGGSNEVNWDAFVVDCPNLSDYRLFNSANDPRNDSRGLRSLKYDVTTPLFSDYAEKDRFIFIPPNERALYDNNEVFDFPVGTIISKTFTLPLTSGTEKVVETRLLIKRATGWRGLPYIWNTQMTNAPLTLGGALLDPLQVTTPAGDTVDVNYHVPASNQCVSCHGVDAKIKPIGPKARMLNKDFNYPAPDGTKNQLSHWKDRGLLQAGDDQIIAAPYLPVWNDPQDGSLEQRARAYIESNCAYCHSKDGRAFASGLSLKADAALDSGYGFCKRPVSAGAGAGDLTFDIVPGDADKSIFVYRMDSTAADVRMPEIGRSAIHKEGLDLVAQWIDTLEGGCP